MIAILTRPRPRRALRFRDKHLWLKKALRYRNRRPWMRKWFAKPLLWAYLGVVFIMALLMLGPIALLTS